MAKLNRHVKYYLQFDFIFTHRVFFSLYTALVFFVYFHELEGLRQKLAPGHTNTRIGALGGQHDISGTPASHTCAVSVPLTHVLQKNTQTDRGHTDHGQMCQLLVMTHPEDSLAFLGFEKCASSREWFWHLAADDEAQYDQFLAAQSWEWIPGSRFEEMQYLSTENLIRNLVEDGGRYLVGGEFLFSLSVIGIC